MKVEKDERGGGLHPLFEKLLEPIRPRPDLLDEEEIDVAGREEEVEQD